MGRSRRLRVENVGDLDGFADHGGLADRALPEPDGTGAKHLELLRRHPVRRPHVKLLGGVVVLVDDARRCRQLSRPRHDRAENRLHVQCRAHRLTDLPEGLELLDRPGQVAGPALQLLKHPDVLDRDERLVGEARHELHLSVGERLDLGLPDRDDADDRLAAQHGHGQDRPEPEELEPVIRHLKPRLGEQVGHVNRSTREGRAAGHGRGSDRQRALLEIAHDVRRETVGDRVAQHVAVRQVDLTAVGSAQPGGVFDQRLEHRPEIGRRPADRLEDLARGPLLLARLGQALAELAGTCRRTAG